MLVKIYLSYIPYFHLETILYDDRYVMKKKTVYKINNYGHVITIMVWRVLFLSLLDELNVLPVWTTLENIHLFFFCNATFCTVFDTLWNVPLFSPSSFYVLLIYKGQKTAFNINRDSPVCLPTILSSVSFQFLDFNLLNKDDKQLCSYERNNTTQHFLTFLLDDEDAQKSKFREASKKRWLQEDQCRKKNPKNDTFSRATSKTEFIYCDFNA